MQAEQVTEETKHDFIYFCKKHRDRMDESYLSDRELHNFNPGTEPSYIVKNHQDKVIGAVSIMLSDDYRSSKKARYRILYSEISGPTVYKLLINKIFIHLKDGDYTYAFTNENNSDHGKQLKSQGFHEERYVFVLERDHLNASPPYLPDGYILKTFEEGKDELSYCQVRNAGFKQLIGYIPLTKEAVAEMKNWEDYLEDGILLLFHDQMPVGVVRTGKDYFKESHYATVNSLAVIPEFQGKGLGRQLLRASLKRGKEKGLEKGFLCVNADNDGAAKLYEQEGFYKTESFVCYYLIK